MDQFLTPPSGDKHDYLTMSPYMWPCNYNPCGKTLDNCNERNGVPWVCAVKR
jgi:hypothetical protein